MAELFGSSYQEILKFLECPVCFETVYPPIFQCKNGHTLCSRCKDGVGDRCPICLVELGDIRSIVLERFLPLLKLPCMYYTAGCNEIVAYESKKNHEERCKYRPYRCPYEGSSPPCDTEGDIPMLLTHLQSSHKLIFHNHSEFQFHTHLVHSIDEDIHSTKGYRCFDQHFCFHFEMCGSEDVAMAYLTIMGDKTLAKKYGYSLTMVRGNTEMNWKGSPRSIRETKEDIRRSGNALFVHRSAINFFRRIHAVVIEGKIWIFGTTDLNEEIWDVDINQEEISNPFHLN